MKITDKYKIIVSERSIRMLSEHLRFIANKNQAASKKIKNKLMDSLKSLEKMPARYPFFEADYIPPNMYHRMFVQKWYLVLYQIKDRVVYVDYIVDCRQDYQWLLDGFR